MKRENEYALDNFRNLSDFSGPGRTPVKGTDNMAPARVRDRVNDIFDILELIIIRIALLGLAGLGTYALLSYHL
jgi:hypothetical protein